MMNIYGSAKGGVTLPNKNNSSVAFTEATIPRNVWYNTFDWVGVPNDEAINKTGDAEKRGEAANNPSSTMIGEEVGQVIIPLKHGGADLTGTVYCYVKATADDATRATIGTLDASTITDSLTNYTFTTASPYTMVNRDTISIECSWSPSDTEYIIIQTSTSDAYDGSNSGKSYYFASGSPPWSAGSTNDMICSISD